MANSLHSFIFSLSSSLLPSYAFVFSSFLSLLRCANAIFSLTMVNHPHAIMDEHASRSNAFGAVHLHRSATANGDGDDDGDGGSGSDGGGDTRCSGGGRIATGDGKRTGHSPKHSLGRMPATSGIGVQSRHPGKLLIDNGEEVMLSSEFVFEGKRHLLSEMLARRLAPAPPLLEHVRVCFCSVVAMLTPGSDLGRVDLLSMLRAGSMNRSEGDEAGEANEGALNGSVFTTHSWDVGGSSEESDGGWENGATKIPKPKMSAVVPTLNLSTIVPSMACESAGNMNASYDSSSPRPASQIGGAAWLKGSNADSRLRQMTPMGLSHNMVRMESVAKEDSDSRIAVRDGKNDEDELSHEMSC